MTNLYTLYWLFIFLCLAESLVLVEGSPVLVTRVFWRWRVFRVPGVRFSKGKRLLFLNPLPWLAEWHTAPRVDVTFSDAGVLPVSSLYGDMLERGASVPGAGEIFEPRRNAAGHIIAAVPSAEERSRLDALCKESGLEGAWGEAGFTEDALARWADPAPLQAKRRRIRVHLVLLQLLCTAQLLCVLIGMPVVLLADLPYLYLFVCIAAMYAVGACVVLVFLLAWRRLMPGRLSGIGKALWMCLYPPAAIRAIQTLSPAMRVSLHESAVVLALAGKGGAQAYKSYLADVLTRLLRRTFSRSLAPEAVSALERANHKLSIAIVYHWKPSRPPALFTPETAEHGAVCYCPLCGVSLAVPTEYCPQCLEIRTLPALPGKEPTPQ